jgi:hypothetical protein
VTKSSTSKGRRVWGWALAVGVILASAGLMSSARGPEQRGTRSQAPPPGDPSRMQPDRGRLASATPESDGPSARLRAGEKAPVAPARPRAIARIEGIAAPGLSVTLDGAGSTGQGLRYRWAQTRGTPVKLDDPTSPIAHFTVPADNLGPPGFLLVVAGPDGSDIAEVTVPIEVRPRVPATSNPRADAGDDQLGMVGRQVTLNGMRSEPAGEAGFRWLQVGGPSIRLKIEDGYILSFVPTVPGIYRFALVVASGSKISTPDEVIVTVGTGSRGASPGDPSTTAGRPSEDSLPTREVARSALAAVRGGSEAAEPLALILEETADRMDLYESYSFAFSEVSRRLEKILPDEPAHRTLWIERLFGPLSGRIVEVMLAEGLDLSRPEGQRTPMSPPQRAALAEQFRLISEGFRSVSHPR